MRMHGWQRAVPVHGWGHAEYDRGPVTTVANYIDRGVRESVNLMATATCARTRPSSSITGSSHMVLPGLRASVSVPAEELIVYCRGEPFRRHIDCETLAEQRVSLNEKDWDTHPACGLDMAVSRINTSPAPPTRTSIIYPLHGNEHVKVVSHTAGE